MSHKLSKIEHGLHMSFKVITQNNWEFIMKRLTCSIWNLLKLWKMLLKSLLVIFSNLSSPWKNGFLESNNWKNLSTITDQQITDFYCTQSSLQEKSIDKRRLYKINRCKNVRNHQQTNLKHIKNVSNGWTFQKHTFSIKSRTSQNINRKLAYGACYWTTWKICKLFFTSR